MLPIPQPVQHSPSLISPISLPHALPHTLRSPFVSSSSTTTTEIPKPSTAPMLYKTEDKVLVPAPAIIPVPLLAATRDNTYAKLQSQSSSSSSSLSEYSSSSSSSSSSTSSESSFESSSNTSSLVDTNQIDQQLIHKEEATREFPVLLLPPSLSLSLAHTKETPLLPPFIPQIPVLTNNICHDGIGSGKAMEADKLAEECKPNVTSTVALSPSEIKELQSSQTGPVSCESELWKSVQISSSSLPPPPPEILPEPPLSSPSSLIPTNSNVHTCATELAIPIPPVITNDSCNGSGNFSQSLHVTTTPQVNVNSYANVDTTNKSKIENNNALNEVNTSTAKPTLLTTAMNIVPVLETSTQSSNLVIFGGARYSADKSICTLSNNKIRHDAESQSKNLFCKACKRCDRHTLQRKCTRLTHELSNLSTLLQLSSSIKENISNISSSKSEAAYPHVACSILAERDANVIKEEQHTMTEEEKEQPQPQEEQQSIEKNLSKITSECSVAHSIINVNELHLEADKKNNLCTIAFFGTPSELQKALANIEEQFEEGNQCRYWEERLECEQQGYVKFERREWGIKRNVGAKMSGDSGNNNNKNNYTIGFGKRATPLQFAAIAKKLANVILLLLHGARDDDEPTLQQILSVDEYALVVKLIDRVNTNAAAMIKSTCRYSEKAMSEIEGKEAHKCANNLSIQQNLELWSQEYVHSAKKALQYE